MAALRDLVCKHRRLTALVILVTLCLKAIVPAGTMIEAVGKTLTVQVCADSQHGRTTMTLVLPADPDDAKGKHQPGKGQGLCAFSALGAPALAGADSIQLGLALIVVMALGLAPVAAPRSARAPRLRPPLRGPPART